LCPVTPCVRTENEYSQFYLTPSLSIESLDKSGAFITGFLEKETGFNIELVIPKSYDELVDNFGLPSRVFHHEQSSYKRRTKDTRW
jgi:ABC-type phosphate/phosphonate transport system substrate-binding protein